MLYMSVTSRNGQQVRRGALLTPWAVDSFRGLGQRRPFSDVNDEESYRDSTRTDNGALARALQIPLEDNSRRGTDG